MGKSTISMAIFNSYVKLPEGTAMMFETVLGWCWPSAMTDLVTGEGRNMSKCHWYPGRGLEVRRCYDLIGFLEDHTGTNSVPGCVFKITHQFQQFVKHDLTVVNTTTQWNWVYHIFKRFGTADFQSRKRRIVLFFFQMLVSQGFPTSYVELCRSRGNMISFFWQKHPNHHHYIRYLISVISDSSGQKRTTRIIFWCLKDDFHILSGVQSLSWLRWTTSPICRSRSSAGVRVS